MNESLYTGFKSVAENLADFIGVVSKQASGCDIICRNDYNYSILRTFDLHFNHYLSIKGKLMSNAREREKVMETFNEVFIA